MSDPTDPADQDVQHQQDDNADQSGPDSEEIDDSTVLACPGCNAERTIRALFCAECGYVFRQEEGALAGESADLSSSTSTPSQPVPEAGTMVRERYRIGKLISDREGVLRFHAEDLGGDEGKPMPVHILRERPTLSATEYPLAGEQKPEESSTRVARSPQENADVNGEEPTWPSLAWEASILGQTAHSCLPRVLDQFHEDGFDYLVEESFEGSSLWDAWDDPQLSASKRFGYLVSLADALDHLHQAGAQLEGFRPDLVVVTPTGVPVITDLTDLLPLPLTPEVRLRGTAYTAPELLLQPAEADARASLYSLGATLYALELGRELTEMDFLYHGVPKPFADRSPDAHPAFCRILGRTFCRDPDLRFPTDDFFTEDPDGFEELKQALQLCGRQLDRVRLEIAAATSTGLCRSGNEDAVALVRGVEGFLDEIEEVALVLLTDGMGGMECGEVAAALAIRTIRDTMLGAPTDEPAAEGAPASGSSGDGPVDIGELWKKRIVTALEAANKKVFEAAVADPAARGMGCTAEAMVLDGRRAVFGHIGDSRVYLLRGRDIQLLTTDQTVVNRLIEVGQISPEEAVNHPRRAELWQAIGGRGELDPELHDLVLQPGDWLVVCSDGLNAHLDDLQIQDVLEQAKSPEQAARRLVNRTLIAGATDNVTVAVVHALP